MADFVRVASARDDQTRAGSYVRGQRPAGGGVQRRRPVPRHRQHLRASGRPARGGRAGRLRGDLSLARVDVRRHHRSLTGRSRIRACDGSRSRSTAARCWSPSEAARAARQRRAAAVDEDRGAVHEAGAVAGQEAGRVGDLLRPAKSAKRNAGTRGILLSGRVGGGGELGAQHRGVGRTRTERVDADARRAQLDGERARERQRGALAGAVGGVPGETDGRRAR